MEVKTEYRPEGWETRKYDFEDDINPGYAYEAGASAMLEALKNGSLSIKKDRQEFSIDIDWSFREKGYLVFIPEE